MTGKKNFKIPAPAVAVVLIVVGAIVAERWLLPSPQSPQPTQPPEPKSLPAPAPTLPPSAPSNGVASATTWSTFHGGTDLVGYTDISMLDKPAKLWQYLADGEIQQPPVANEKGIYVASVKGSIIALDMNGKKRWVKQVTRPARGSLPAGPERLNAPLSCFRSTVLIGSTAGIVHALDSGSGDERWTYDVNGEVLGAVNVWAPEKAGEAARLFVIERSEGVLHCVDFETGKSVWHSDTINRCDGSAAVSNGMVVYGSCATQIHVFTTQDNRPVRNVTLCDDCQVASGVAVVGDRVYSGSRSGQFYCADVRTGRVVWMNKDSQKEIFTTPVVTPHLVVFGSEDGNVYALDRESGALKWRFDSHGTPSSPIAAGDKVIVSSKGILYYLKLESGDEIWKYEVSDGITGPSIVNGMVVVGSEDGTVAAFK